VESKTMEAKTFADLVLTRRADGFDLYAIEIDGRLVDRAFYIATSFESVEELADLYIYLSFEFAKLNVYGLKMEARRIDSFRKVVDRLGRDLFDYIERLKILAPDLLLDRTLTLESKDEMSSIILEAEETFNNKINEVGAEE